MDYKYKGTILSLLFVTVFLASMLCCVSCSFQEISEKKDQLKIESSSAQYTTTAGANTTKGEYKVKSTTKDGETRVIRKNVLNEIKYEKHNMSKEHFEVTPTPLDEKKEQPKELQKNRADS